jgi:DNA invertase Pin-like site-specific DNA recombinase
MMTAIYARVSTTDKGQDPDLQLRPLREYCQSRWLEVVGEYVDYTSGAKDRRPELDKMMDALRKRQVDCVIVWKLDRFGRSFQHLINSINEIDRLGVVFVSYSENIDLSTPAGRLMFHIIASMCEFERALIKERVRAGLANARAKGKKLGRRGLAPIDRKKIIEAYDTTPPLSVRDVARVTKIPTATVGKVIKAYKEGKLDRDGFEYARALV